MIKGKVGMKTISNILNSKKLSDFLGSDSFLIVCTIATLICWSFNFVVMGFVVLAVLGCLILLTQSSLKGLFAVVAFAQFVAFEDMDQVVTKFHVWCYVGVGVAVISCLAIYIFKNFIKTKKKPHGFCHAVCFFF